MKLDCYKEFLQELDCIQQNKIGMYGRSYDLMTPVLTLESDIKQFYPMNEVPVRIYEELKTLKETIELAQFMLCNICERAKTDVEELKKKAYPNE